jgi:hypothetical protein
MLWYQYLWRLHNWFLQKIAGVAKGKKIWADALSVEQDQTVMMNMFGNSTI